MSNADYKLVELSLSQADGALDIFKKGLSPTSLDSIARHTTTHLNAMLSAGPGCIDLVPIIIGLMLKLTCDKEARAFLKAEEAADAVQDK